MTRYKGLDIAHQPDGQALIDNILRKGTPKRVHHIELFHDAEIAAAIDARFGLGADLNPADPRLAQKKYIARQRFLGFDHVSVSLVDLAFTYNWSKVEDTSELRREDGRNFMDEHAGPITSWEEFESYPWPDPATPSATRELEWFQDNLPEDMIIVSHTGHFMENLSWLLGYETLCYALYDQRDLVEAVAEKLLAFHVAEVERILQFDRVRALWGSDDMGFRSGLLISRDDMRRFVLGGHREMAAMSHAAGRPYLLHSCGKLADIMDDLIDDVKLDGKHSFEDTIEDVRQVKHTYGRRIALLGGIDVDFLCRSDEPAIRARVRETLEICLPGGGYCLGTGNSVANYIPLDHYLAMLDEGRLYAT